MCSSRYVRVQELAEAALVDSNLLIGRSVVWEAHDVSLLMCGFHIRNTGVMRAFGEVSIQNVRVAHTIVRIERGGSSFAHALSWSLLRNIMSTLNHGLVQQGRRYCMFATFPWHNNGD